MIDSLVKLAEKLNELLKYRSERRTKRFAAVVEPVFVAMKAVHSDYLAIFETFVRAMRGGADVRVALQEFDRARLILEGERHSIIARVGELTKLEALTDHRKIFVAVRAYFVGRAPPEPLGHTADAPRDQQTVSYTFSLFARRASFDPANATARMVEYAEHTVGRLRRRWDRIAREYARQLAQSLG